MSPQDEPVGENIFTSPVTPPVESSPSAFGDTVFYLLREDGFRFLREDGDFILRE